VKPPFKKWNINTKTTKNPWRVTKVASLRHERFKLYLILE